MVYTIRKLTLPCITIPCVVGNVARIRLALEDPAWCPHPGANGAVVVVQPTGNSTLKSGDIVLAVDGVRVAGTSTPTPHDVTWLRPPGTPCPVQVLRGGSPVDLSVETNALEHISDVSVGELQALFDRRVLGYPALLIRVMRSALRVTMVDDVFSVTKKLEVRLKFSVTADSYNEVMKSLHGIPTKSTTNVWVEKFYTLNKGLSTPVDGPVHVSASIIKSGLSSLRDLLYKLIYDTRRTSAGPWKFELYEDV